MDARRAAHLLSYRRLEHDGMGIHVQPDSPDWFVPSSAADRLLRAVTERATMDTALNGLDSQARLRAQRFLARVPRSGQSRYAGRANHLVLKSLKECWFHITNPTNVQQEICCSCAVPSSNGSSQPAHPSGPKHVTGCMVCGTELMYSQASRRQPCYYCGQEVYGNVVCEAGHFVCDKCHAHDALSIVEEVCLNSQETDMVALMAKIRNHPAFPMHGPEHHSMVPAIILTAYRNTTGRLDRDQIITGIERGGAIAGGSCAFYGVCGAAVGVGIAFSVILRSDPYQAVQRQRVQQATAEVLQAIGGHEAPRCFQRDCWIALTEVARLSERYVGVRLRAETSPVIDEQAQIGDCLE